MKTTPFLIRVTICFLLSLLPPKELDYRVYSGRLEVRGRPESVSPVVIVKSSGPVAEIEKKFGAVRVWTLMGWRAASPLEDSDGVVRRGNGLRDAPYLINYLGPPGTVPICEPADPCPEARGRHILVAPAREVSEHLFRTPLGEMSRAEIVASEIYTFAEHKGISEAAWLERSLITLALIVGGAFYIIYYPVHISALAVTGMGLAILGPVFQLAFQWLRIYVPSIQMAASLLVTYLVFTGYRLAFQENLQWRQLKQAQYLRELDQMKTNFLSLVSHDLKTPIAKIQAMVDLMRRQGLTKDSLDSIENSNNELKHYITSILNLSKIESQKVILNKKSNDINAIIQQTIKRLRTATAQKNITIEDQLEPLFSIEFDEDLIRQVLTNIVDNAIKFSPQGSRVIIRTREVDGFVQVQVEDFGAGIPKDQLPLMFRKFSRFLRPMREQVKGTGLGLYLSRYFIELHGGTIKVESAEGQGTTFTFTLPLHGDEVETILS